MKAKNFFFLPCLLKCRCSGPITRKPDSWVGPGSLPFVKLLPQDFNANSLDPTLKTVAQLAYGKEQEADNCNAGYYMILLYVLLNKCGNLFNYIILCSFKRNMEILVTYTKKIFELTERSYRFESSSST